MRADYGSPPPSATPDPVASGGSGDPMADFDAWFADAVARGGSEEPNAMCLATCSSDGSPSARFVLLKGVDAPATAFHFYTNHGSRKAKDLDRLGARAALVFYWESTRRSVRVEGAVSRLPASEADVYFASRPRASQVGAHASHQSARLAGGQSWAGRAGGRGSCRRRHGLLMQPPPCRARPRGGGTRSPQTASSSGRGGRRGCMNGWSTRVQRAAGGSARYWRHEEGFSFLFAFARGGDNGF